MANETKTCTKCLKVKAVTEFGPVRTSKDGLRHWCKRCATDYVIELRRRNHERSLSRERAYHEKNREARNAVSRRMNKEFRPRLRANRRIRHEVEMGRMPPASECTCANCGAAAKLYHHSDYNKPLDVVPMCHGCHRKWHASYEPVEATTR